MGFVAHPIAVRPLRSQSRIYAAQRPYLVRAHTNPA